MPQSATSWETWTDANKLKLLGELKARRWQATANPGQTDPSGDWKVWWARGGRGAGKTRTGAEWLTREILKQPATPDDPMPEWGVIAPTRAAARSICVEGESGLLRALGPAVENWNRSDGELFVKNGAIVRIDGSDYGGERIEGKNLRGAWADEIGKWKKPDQAWKEALWFAVRTGPNPRIIATGTPKGKKGVVKILLDAPSILAMTHLLVQHNRANLAPGVFEANLALYAGTRLERQEIHGEILEDVEGALWTWELIERARIPARAYWLPQQIGRTVVAIDPAITAKDESDETGIVTAQTIVEFDDDMAAAWEMAETPDAGAAPHVVVLDDRSGKYTPTQWARKAIAAYREFEADCIVAEANQGGEMVSQTIHAIDPNVPVRLVWASKGKRTRAEPVSALYEQDRVHHDKLPLPPKPALGLEDELTTWVPGEASPNRLDALVWAVTELLIAPSTGFVPEPVSSEPTSLTADLLDKVM